MTVDFNDKRLLIGIAGIVAAVIITSQVLILLNTSASFKTPVSVTYPAGGTVSGVSSGGTVSGVTPEGPLNGSANTGHKDE